MKKEYDVSVTLILERSISIEAENEKEAKDIVMNQITKETFDLDDYHIDYQLQTCEV